MLRSYEALYEDGRLKWVGEKPSIDKALVIVTMLPDRAADGLVRVRRPSPRIAGKGKISGDIMAPAATESDWEALR